MCLAVPMQLIEIRDDDTGVAELDGSRRDVGLALIREPRIGDFVIVHAGFAIERLDRAEANDRIRLFEELAAAMEPS